MSVSVLSFHLLIHVPECPFLTALLDGSGDSRHLSRCQSKSHLAMNHEAGFTGALYKTEEDLRVYSGHFSSVSLPVLCDQDRISNSKVFDPYPVI